MDMLATDVAEIRRTNEERAEAQATFRGKIEGSVRVLHFFINVGVIVLTSLTAAIISLCAFAFNAFGTLNQIKEKFADFNPTKNEMKIDRLDNDVTDLRSRVGNLESARIQNGQDPHKPRH